MVYGGTHALLNELLPGLVRLSIGITGSLHARIQQIDRAVKAVGLTSLPE